MFPPRIWKSNKMNFHHPSWVKYPCACEWHSAGQRQMSSLFTFGLGAACQVWNTDFCVLSKASSLQDRHFSSNFLPKMHNTTTMKSLGCWVFFFPTKTKLLPHFLLHSSFIAAIQDQKTGSNNSPYGLCLLICIFFSTCLIILRWFVEISSISDFCPLIKFGLNCPMHLRDSLGDQNYFQKQDQKCRYFSLPLPWQLFFIPAPWFGLLWAEDAETSAIPKKSEVC